MTVYNYSLRSNLHLNILIGITTNQHPCKYHSICIDFGPDCCYSCDSSCILHSNGRWRREINSFSITLTHWEQNFINYLHCRATRLIAANCKMLCDKAKACSSNPKLAWGNILQLEVISTKASNSTQLHRRNVKYHSYFRFYTHLVDALEFHLLSVSACVVLVLFILKDWLV